MIYFTSDLHLNHEAAIRMCNRPFETLEEMNLTLINNINAMVKKHDTLYILGDATYKGGLEDANKLISQINGKKILIRGNHDRKYDPTLFDDIRDFLEVHLGCSGQNYSISLMHYPMVEWPKSRHGSIHLHGHQHNGPEYNQRMKEQGIRRYDVGVDANNYCPVSLQQILNFMGL